MCNVISIPTVLRYVHNNIQANTRDAFGDNANVRNRGSINRVANEQVQNILTDPEATRYFSEGEMNNIEALVEADEQRMMLLQQENQALRSQLEQHNQQSELDWSSRMSQAARYAINGAP